MKRTSILIKIGYYSNTLQLGGSEVYLKAVLENIDYKKHKVVLFCPKMHPLFDVFSKREGIEVMCLDGKGIASSSAFGETPRNDKKKAVVCNDKGMGLFHRLVPNSIKLFIGTVKDILKLRRLFIEHRVDLLHFNDTGCEPPVIAAKLAGVPIIIGTYHVLPSYDKEKCDWVRRLIENISTRCMDMGIAVSNATKKAWMDRTCIKSKNIEVIYNGVDLAKFDKKGFNKDDLRKELGVEQGCQIIGVPARLHPMKGHKYLIQAVLKIKDEIPDVKFLLVGDGELKEELQNVIISLKLEDTINFLGHRNDIIELMHLFDIAVLPSVALEALPYVLIEAMACKKPVVASSFSGIPEVIEDGVTGILVPPGDSGALANAIIKLLKDEELRKKMGEAGRKRVEKYFTQDIMLKKTYGLYERLLAASPHPNPLPKGERDEKYKVAVISSGLEHIARGVETWAKDLAYALREKGIEVMLYKGSGASNNGFERSIPCVRCGSNLSKRVLNILPRFSWRFGMGSDFQMQQTTFTLNLLPELMMRKFDIIHTQDPDCANILRIAKKIGLIRSKIILAHGTEEPFEFIKKFDYLQHLAPYHMEEAMKNGVNGATKQFAIGNFVDTERFRPEDWQRKALQLQPKGWKKELGILEDAFVVLSVAAIKKVHKRIDYLIDEVARVIQNPSPYPSPQRGEGKGVRGFFLVIAGARTNETDELIKMGKEKLGERVIFLTDFSRERMNEIYAMADVFALCSLKEMMPIAVLEAISSGVSVIGNKYPVIEWMIGNGGECIDMTKEGELAKAIEKYMDETYRKEKSLKAREHALKNFSKEVVVEQIIGMYRDVVCEKTHATPGHKDTKTQE